MRSRVVAPLGGLLVCLVGTGCGRTPTPLNPAFSGSIGSPNRGVLTNSRELPRSGNGFKWLRNDDHHHGLPRFVAAIERAAGKVATERPGAMLSVGDISALHGGRLMPHLSHRSGRDADLLFYWTTLAGAPVDTPGWIHLEADGLAWDEKGKRFLRFDVEREWLLVKTLVEDPEARVQWVFANHNAEALLIERARARGEPSETIVRAMDVMLEPHPGGAHDDHVHVRTQCTSEEIAAGCEPTGPPRDWLAKLDRAVEPASDPELALALFHPFAKP
jgi:penicillin-insensitive murein endopeptidase